MSYCIVQPLILCISVVSVVISPFSFLILPEFSVTLVSVASGLSVFFTFSKKKTKKTTLGFIDFSFFFFVF